MVTKITSDDVSHIAGLAHIPVTNEEKKKLAVGFTQTICVVNELFIVDVTGIEPMYQVTGIVNAFREDVINEARMFTQKQALSNASNAHNGFFVVSQIIDQI